MAWPSALTTNSDITTYVFEQGITRMLESGDFDNLHQGVATEVRNWLESNSIDDADDVSNTSAFAPAAANLFVSKLLVNRDKQLSDHYRLEYLRLMRNTRAELVLAAGPATGGTFGEVAVIKQMPNYHTRRRSGAVFPNRRE